MGCLHIECAAQCSITFLVCVITANDLGPDWGILSRASHGED